MQVYRRILLIVCFYISLHCAFAQPATEGPVVSGPMLGQVELRTACIWIELSPQVRTASIRYWKQNNPGRPLILTYKGPLGNAFNPIRFEIGGLEMNTNYAYDFLLNGKPSSQKGNFSTKELWQWRKPPPDFSFLAGSCAYFNQAIYDRPGKPYGADSSIFETMAKTPAAFMIWLGDNWYTREVDHSSTWGLWYRASHDRRFSILQNFLKAMPQYAIWDDHDYGPDDSDGSYILKDSSRQVFMHYWCNPSFGQDGKGIYTTVTYADVDFFLTDDRYFRSADAIEDTVQGYPNSAKHFFGEKQMYWLKNALASSEATFKIVVVGSQVLNQINNDFECLHHYPAEYQELLDFITHQKINGVIFLTGDRHHSEVISLKRFGAYTLFDVTSSPLTSSVSHVRGIELNNPARVPGTLVEEQNFSRITISGKPGERKFRVEFINGNGQTKAEWSIHQNELR